ncbi:MAG: hypothetical protein IPL00_03290 [Gammaproteobacteria bacterium]|nr:hypothetical protein [Gammaproteobacteria bacterium]
MNGGTLPAPRPEAGGHANLTDTQDLTLVWDMVGNLTSRRDQGAARDTTETYTYDALNRLRTVSLNGTQSDSVTYDAFGNFKTKTGIGTYSYLAPSRTQ